MGEADRLQPLSDPAHGDSCSSSALACLRTGVSKVLSPETSAALSANAANFDVVAGIPQNYPRFRRSARESQWSLSPHRFFIRSIVDADKGFFSHN
ncbi:MAG: hypothetical protein WB662_07795 [Methyloceanibacter sp.]